mmetsp:Transcript_22851/g.86530  ORF Transcript_22851/g.86530 Transcript_22851/m.86530 type:complete len:294 (-) Transcript_22851:2754-3635(-)
MLGAWSSFAWRAARALLPAPATRPVSGPRQETQPLATASSRSRTSGPRSEASPAPFSRAPTASRRCPPRTSRSPRSWKERRSRRSRERAAMPTLKQGRASTRKARRGRPRGRGRPAAACTRSRSRSHRCGWTRPPRRLLSRAGTPSWRKQTPPCLCGERWALEAGHRKSRRAPRRRPLPLLAALALSLWSLDLTPRLSRSYARSRSSAPRRRKWPRRTGRRQWEAQTRRRRRRRQSLQFWRRPAAPRTARPPHSLRAAPLPGALAPARSPTGLPPLTASTCTSLRSALCTARC